MVKSIQRFHIVLYPLIFMLLLLTSCGARKKSAGSGRVLTSGNVGAKGGIPTDASDARGKPLSGSKMENYADLLGVSVRELDNKSLYTFIDNWMGTPHRFGGTQKSGVDCSGFVGMLYNAVYRKNLPRTSRDMGDNVKRKYENKLKEGDLIFFSFGGKNIDHVGVYLHNNKFVHVSTRKGVIISDIKDSWYYKYFVRAGTPKI
ncbi:C40 family peptidase [Sphingobacterium deserti]|uniref:NLP/P60 protein n=1 Tax=Sphingobacterium deserti TaxID=1229276 RepID=A0A0B8TBR6_9SPHI|nr:NlpC/P60 family protein [Sphingobacterium deserti]KGE15665.1 NLP/P60 protein [Sphingobacterium deserti]